MRHIVLFIFFFAIVTLGQENITHVANLNIDRSETQRVCLKLTSDSKTLVTRTNGAIDLWRTKDLKHIGRINGVSPGYGCDLYRDDKSFIVRDMNRVYLYDIKALKHLKNFEIPNIRHNDAIMSASFSENGRFINTFEHVQTKPGYNRPALFRYDIKTGSRELITELPIQSNRNMLKGDTLYTLDYLNNKSVTVFDLISKKRRMGTQKDKDTYNALWHWQDCTTALPTTKICTIQHGMKYTLASGDLQRIELNATQVDPPKVTMRVRKPLHERYLYETDVKMPYLIMKGTQEYYGWDIDKGEQIWSIRQKVTAYGESDTEPNKGIKFFPDGKRVLVLAGLEDKILDINLRTGIFRDVPKFGDIVAYSAIDLSDDAQTLYLTATEQKKPFALKTHAIHVGDWKLLPTASRVEHHLSPSTSRYVSTHRAWTGDHIEEYIELFRYSDDVKLATFYVFDGGEWMVVTPQGYFNASSIRVLPNLMKQNEVSDFMMQKYTDKWYRPDIVRAVLNGHNIDKLVHRAPRFEIPRHAVDNNQFQNSLKAMIVQNGDLSLLSSLAQNIRPQDIDFLKEGIETATTVEAYRAYYRTLARLDIKDKDAFIASRIEQLDAHASEQEAFLNYLFFRKNQAEKEKYLYVIVHEHQLTDEAKIVIARHSRKLDLQTYEPLLWEVWEKQYFVDDSVREYLEKKDPVRAKVASKNAVSHHTEEAIVSIPLLYKKVQQKQQSSYRLDISEKLLSAAFQTLTDVNCTLNLGVTKKIALERFTAFLNGEAKRVNTKVYLDFLMKYESPSVKKSVEKMVMATASKFTKDEGAIGQGDMPDITAFLDLLKYYYPYQSGSVVKMMIQMADSVNWRVQKWTFATMDALKDPKFVNILLAKLDFTDIEIANNALRTLLYYNDPTVTSRVIAKLNRLGDCTKIWSLDVINSDIAGKVDSGEFAKYKCGNL